MNGMPGFLLGKKRGSTEDAIIIFRKNMGRFAARSCYHVMYISIGYAGG